MGFVKSAEEIARIEHALSFPRFVGGQMLSVEFATDESVVARPAGFIHLQLAAAPGLIKRLPPARSLADLKSWPWISLSGRHFWDTSQISLQRPDGTEQSLRISPVLLSEGVTSVREAVKDGLGIAVLPKWLIRDEPETGELVPILPRWRLRLTTRPSASRARMMTVMVCGESPVRRAISALGRLSWRRISDRTRRSL